MNDLLAVMPITAFNRIEKEYGNDSIKVIQQRAIEMLKID
jgi:hypothetical protein